MADRPPHRCDDDCVCPVHRTPLIYHPAGDDHACRDIACEHGHGGLNPALAAFDRIGMGWLKRFAVEQGFEDAAAVARFARNEQGARPVKTCLRAELVDGQPGRLLDLSFVSDDHEFGPSADGSEIHIPGRGEFTVTRGTPYEKLARQPPAVNGIPFSAAIVNDDGTISRRFGIRRRDPAEAAELIRSGYAKLGIPPDIAEAMIEETLKP